MNVVEVGIEPVPGRRWWQRTRWRVVASNGFQSHRTVTGRHNAEHVAAMVCMKRWADTGVLHRLNKSAGGLDHE